MCFLSGQQISGILHLCDKKLIIMHFLTKLSAFATCLLWAQLASAQNMPRLFLDGPAVFFTAPDVAHIGNNLGLGSDLTMNIATHNTLLRMGGGIRATVDPQNQDLLKSMLTTPFIKVEAGAGKYRSNGNKCAKSHRPAYTVLAKAGVQYDFLTGSNRPEGSAASHLDYTVGAEIGYFYIRDIIRNSEVFLSGNYSIKSKTAGIDAGFRMFFNLRGKRR